MVTEADGVWGDDLDGGFSIGISPSLQGENPSIFRGGGGELSVGEFPLPKMPAMVANEGEG